MPSGIPFTPEFKVQVVETLIKEELTKDERRELEYLRAENAYLKN